MQTSGGAGLRIELGGAKGVRTFFHESANDTTAALPG